MTTVSSVDQGDPSNKLYKYHSNRTMETSDVRLSYFIFHEDRGRINYSEQVRSVCHRVDKGPSTEG